MLKISCWNTDWATPTSKRGKLFIDKFDSDIICLQKDMRICSQKLDILSLQIRIMVIKRKMVVEK